MTAHELNQTKERCFPVEILGGDLGLRPDGVIWSRSTETVVWIELTSPWEDNMTLRHSEKHTRYTQLKIVCEANGWKVHALCVDVGCRGHVSQSFEWMCKGLELTTEEERKELTLSWRRQHCTAATQSWLLDIKSNRYQRHCWMDPNGTETITSSR